MAKVLDAIRDFMEKQGIPGRDGYDLSSSKLTFSDGANSMNPSSDISLPILTSIRRAVKIPHGRTVR